MAVDLHGTGISVKLIEPGPVDTEIWDQPGNDDPIYDGPKFSPEEVAQGILEALGRDGRRDVVIGEEDGQRKSARGQDECDIAGLQQDGGEEFLRPVRQHGESRRQSADDETTGQEENAPLPANCGHPGKAPETT